METDPKRDDDLLARLIRQAGRREQPPREHYERVLGVATQAFQAKTRQRRQRRAAAWMAAGVAAAVGIVAVLLNLTQQSPPQVARIDKVIGTIDTRRGEQAAWSGIRSEAQKLHVGESVRTSAASRLGVLMRNGVSLRLAETTQVRLLAPDRLMLLAGKIYVDSGRSPGDERRLVVATPVGTATDIGTQFEVRYFERELRLRIREGRVNLERESSELSAGAGDQLLIDRSGRVQRARIAADDPDWSWTQAVAPNPDLDERPLSDLLTWVSRETGRSVRYEQPILQLRAETTILHGSIRNLEPLEALEAMLATTDFEYALLEDGTILIGKKTNVY